MKDLRMLIFWLALLGLLTGCGAPHLQPPLGMDGGSSPAASGKYLPKVDNFQVILDASTSMDENGKNDFVDARQLVSRLNQGLPADVKYTAGLRTFGHSSYQSKQPTDLVYGMTGYSKSGFNDALAGIKYVGGESPLAAAITAAGNDLKPLSGSSALIIVSDGQFMDAAPAAAEKVKGMLGENLCIYTVSVGKDMNGAGLKLLDKVAAAGKCGFATTDTALASDAGMKDFVQKVFLADKPAPAPKPAPVVIAPKDSDGDGVFDDKDKCPNTPKGEFVDSDGCTLKLTLHINFDFDRAEIKPEFKTDLDNAAAFIKRNSKVPYILIAGHTDAKGTDEYNQQLSEKRAKAVRQYLIDKHGIDANRLGTKGYGRLQPVADNTTKEGRYQNRRVEIICCVVKPM